MTDRLFFRRGSLLNPLFAGFETFIEKIAGRSSKIVTKNLCDLKNTMVTDGYSMISLSAAASSTAWA